MTKRSSKNGHHSPMERLIAESVERALATWLSGQAIRLTEELGKELWNGSGVSEGPITSPPTPRSET